MNAISPSTKLVRNARWDNVRRSLSLEHTFQQLRVEGKLPLDLNGTTWRSGPGVFNRFGTEVGHPFEADGVVMAARFTSGKVAGMARVVHTREFEEEEARGRYLYTSNSSILRRVRCGLTGRAKNTGNTAMWTWGERLFAQVETSLPLEIAPHNGDLLGETDFDGLLGTSFSAHPHRVPARRATYNFGLRYGVFPGIDLFELPDVGKGRKVCSFSLPWSSMVHDFMATERHAVFIVGPAKLRLGRAMMQQPPFEEWFDWDPRLGSEIIIVALDNPSDVRRIATESFWCWHLANGWDEGHNIVLDIARYRDMDSLRALGAGTEITPPVLQRMHIDLQKRSVRMESQPDDNCEFPRVHGTVEGARHRYVWGVHGDVATGREGIVRFDLDAGKKDVWWTPPGGFVSEPLLAPRAGGGELDAWVLTQAYDKASDQHYVAVLDARRPSDGPVAKVWYNHRLPCPFHGTWIPSR